MFAFMIDAQEKTAKSLSDIEQKNLQLEQLRRENDELKGTNLLLQAQLDQLKRLIFGSRSERFEPVVNPQQITLALEVETKQAGPAEKEKIAYERDRKSTSTTIHPGRTPLPAHLPRIEIVIEPQHNVEGLPKIGTVYTEQLEYEPGKFFVKRFARPKYALPGGEGVIIGDLPSRPIEKGIPGPGLLASILIEKYTDHLPLYRQMERFKRERIIIADATMSGWVKAACKLILPLSDVLRRKVLGSFYLEADETPIRVLDRNKKGKTHRGFYWVYRDPLNNLVLFDYREGRGRDGPREMLKDFKGYLQTDGYSVYESFDNGKIKLLHCMAHARRYFDQALDNDRPRAAYVLEQMQKLYAVEQAARDGSFSSQQRYNLRQCESLPVLHELHRWLKDNITAVLPKSAIGQAIAYSLSRWEKLMIYASDGTLEIDNNLVENSIRPIALGRKNYLFAGSHSFARHAATIYSLLGTCKIKGVEPFAWLRNVLKVIPDYKANRLEELLP